METEKDYFISYAFADKDKYIEPLSKALRKYQVSFWLDSLEMNWGDNLAKKINDGLKKSKFVILCLSENYIDRPWTEIEMSAALSIQNSQSDKKVLPLILNSKEQILQAYPLVAGLIYREYQEDPDILALELASLVSSHSVKAENQLQITIESINTGEQSTIQASPRASIWWLVEQSRQKMKLKDALDTVKYPFYIPMISRQKSSILNCILAGR